MDDLVRIRDIGASTVTNSGARTFSISPTGKHIAFQIRRAEPNSNSFCLSMAVLKIGSKALPRIVDEGGELIRWNFEFRGKVGFPSGVPITVTPRWSPDGAWILFLKSVDQTVQVWRARADGTRTDQLTHSAVDIEDFRITEDGQAIIFATRPELAAMNRAIDREADRGYRYDDRFSPMTTSRPFAEGGGILRYYVQNLVTGIERPAYDAEQRLFVSPGRELVADEVIAPDQTGRRAWVIPPVRDQFFWHSRLVAQDQTGKVVKCAAPVCTTWVSKPWWSADGRKVRYFRREGWAQNATAIYEWDVDQSVPRRIFSTLDLLFECDPLKDTLICLRESSAQPRRLVQIDLSHPRMVTLFDPNPEFARLTLGHVERLEWKNRFDVESYGDLIYPVGYRTGRRYPLIVVQYETRGFLRGGTGDEYPIQVFANHGFMVLSLQRPRDIGYFRAKDESGVDAANLEDFADRSSVQSSLDTGLRLLADRGLIDENRLGITGLSDGVATVQFALIHNPIFAAAAMSNCCFDASSLLLVGPKASRHFQAVGYPAPAKDDGTFWDQLSLARNAARIETPILMQEADDEYLTGLETYSALADAGKKVDMFVYPGEHHIKWQPAHRRSIYLRNIWWFDYWLRGVRPSSPEGSAEVSVWDALKRRDEGLARTEPRVSTAASQ
ncbi:dipeptidyl aminopeptidase/acylaminoacyl peptidase [Sphingomonas sp. BE270]|nr:dipeptidyl aminopeptidase/acylaminoacyl peptidase [Sphingomonas sp. BE270]